MGQGRHDGDIRRIEALERGLRRLKAALAGLLLLGGPAVLLGQGPKPTGPAAPRTAWADSVETQKVIIRAERDGRARAVLDGEGLEVMDRQGNVRFKLTVDDEGTTLVVIDHERKTLLLVPQE